MTEFAHLRQPIVIGGFEVRNRVMLTVHGPRLPARRHLRYLEERVAGGVGLVGLSAATGLYDMPIGPGHYRPDDGGGHDAVPPHPLSTDGLAYYDRFIRVLAEQAEVVHRHGGRCVGQVYHPGASRHIDLTSDNYQPVYAPSNVADEFRRNPPHALTANEIDGLVAAFGHAGRRVAEAGCDGIEIHGAHGYLVNEFLSPYHNLRTDHYGGSLDNRMRFLLEVVDAMRVHVGGEYPIGIRLNGRDRVDGGLTTTDMQEIARRCELAGLVYVSISGGTYGGVRGGFELPYVPPAYFPEGTNVDDAAAIRKAVGIPVIVTSRIVDLHAAEEIVARGSADMVGMTRALIADPALVRKSFGGEADRVIPCIGCNECHSARTVACPVNTAAGHEDELAIVPADVPVTVLIAGGGPAGMECARVAALRGHRVILCERGDRLGGMIAAIASDGVGRGEFRRYLRHAEAELRRLPVDIRLGAECSVELAREVAADAVVLATGACDVVPASDRAGSAADVFTGRFEAGNRVAVVGGIEDHLTTLTVADLLARQGRAVTVITELFHPGERVEPATRQVLTKRLLERGVTIVPLTAVDGVAGDALSTRHVLTGTRGSLGPFDGFVYAAERLPDDRLRQPLEDAGFTVHLAGDALAPRRFLHATLDGARLALQL